MNEFGGGSPHSCLAINRGSASKKGKALSTGSLVSLATRLSEEGGSEGVVGRDDVVFLGIDARRGSERVMTKVGWDSKGEDNCGVRGEVWDGVDGVGGVVGEVNDEV
jgi:hypothetical protein